MNELVTLFKKENIDQSLGSPMRTNTFLCVYKQEIIAVNVEVP